MLNGFQNTKQLQLVNLKHADMEGSYSDYTTPHPPSPNLL